MTLKRVIAGLLPCKLGCRRIQLRFLLSELSKEVPQFRFVLLFFVFKIFNVGINHRLGIRVRDTLFAEGAYGPVLISNDLCAFLVKAVMRIDLLLDCVGDT